jgi:hypothetical protein
MLHVSFHQSFMTTSGGARKVGHSIQFLFVFATCEKLAMSQQRLLKFPNREASRRLIDTIPMESFVTAY